jgi:peroxiredoxin
VALTPSTMAPLGTPAPDFRLPDTDGQAVALADCAAAPALLVAFLCNHCPYVQHARAAFARLARDYQARGVEVVAISSNDAAAYPDDSPARMKEEKAQAGYTFPYLYDESQQVAKAYRAACTPDFFVYGPDRRLAYRGQLDASRPGNDRPNDGADLRAALDAVLAGQAPPAEQVPSAGCNIKWKPGNAPTPA